MYSSFFPENLLIPQDKLIRLLMAEGLIQEIPGERMEDIAEKNIEKLIELEMVQVPNKEWSNWIACAVPVSYLHIVAGDENIIITNANSEEDIPLNIRRLRIKEINSTIASNLNNIHLSIRSLFISCKDFSGNHLNALETIFHSLKLLRVLDLEFIKFKTLPEEVGNLIHLRYLGLGYSSLNKLPDSISNLRNLETLDIHDSNITALSTGILNLQQLRHLEIYKYPYRILVPTGIGGLTNLQTLNGLYAGGGIARELCNLTQLRKLGIVYLSEEHASELHVSIMKMTKLISLALSAENHSHYVGFSFNEELLPSLEHFSAPPCLRKLRLVGCLQEIPDWLNSMENLTELMLSNSNLLENPTSILQFLPNLKLLYLKSAYTAKHIGREFCKSGGFPSLEVLIIGSSSLTAWTELEEGALQSLKYLKFSYCPRLRTLPEGLQLITTLQELYVFPLHGDLARKLSPRGGQENYKIKHIPMTNLED